MRVRVPIYLMIVLLMSCSSPKTYGQAQGVIIIHCYLFEPDTVMTIDSKILFKDKKSIQEVPQLNTIEDSSGKRFFTKILHYSYLDPDRNVCYSYTHFSDTTKILKYYNDIDSVVIDGGWNFYSNQNFAYNILRNLNDTVIKGINYNRIRIDQRISNNGSDFSIYYFECNKKGILVQFFKSLGDKIGCPIVRIDSWLNNKLVMISEIEFTSDSLSNEEASIFEKWSHNIRER